MFSVNLHSQPNLQTVEPSVVLDGPENGRSFANPWGLLDEPLLGLIEIPAGSFTMGVDGSQADPGERPGHQVSLPTYFIGRHEVTVGQFAVFMKEVDPVSDLQNLEGPDDYPVRDVSWAEALAYCAWLTDKLRAWGGTPQVLAGYLRGEEGERPWRITLPSEAEWEKAARGADGRMYPWGNQRPDSTLANFGGTGPKPVGSYPTGASAYEVLDMAGNVLEWTRSLWGEDVVRPQFRYPYKTDDGRENLNAPMTVRRVLRGGSFYLDASGVQTTRRFRYDLGSRFGTRGFRIVMSPFPY